MDDQAGNNILQEIREQETGEAEAMGVEQKGGDEIDQGIGAEGGGDATEVNRECEGYLRLQSKLQGTEWSWILSDLENQRGLDGLADYCGAPGGMGDVLLDLIQQTN